MLRYLIQRLLFFPLALLITVTGTYFLLNTVPGDIARSIAGDQATPEQIAVVAHRYELDLPTPIRYLHYLERLSRGDLGTSLQDDQPVGPKFLAKLPATLELVIPALFLSIIVGIALGTVGAYFGGHVDRGTSWLITLLQSVPEFLLGIGLLFLFYVTLQIAPSPVGRLGLLESAPPRATGFYVIDAAVAQQWDVMFSALKHLALPVITLSVAYSVVFARTARAAMGAALQSQYVQFARACGLSEWQVVYYALLEARTPLLTYGAIILSHIIGGAAIVETVFSWQGLGQYALASTLVLDVNVIVAYTILVGVITLTTYFLLDVLLVALDPRVALAQR